VLVGFFALVFGSLLSYGALQALVTEADEVRQVRVLRRRGRTAGATIVSLGVFDPECSTRPAVIRFEVEPGREAQGAAHLRWKGQPELVAGAQVQVRYDPETPDIVASEAGGRQGRAEIGEAVVVFFLMVVMVLPTSICLVYFGLRTLLP